MIRTYFAMFAVWRRRAPLVPAFVTLICPLLIRLFHSVANQMLTCRLYLHIISRANLGPYSFPVGTSRAMGCNALQASASESTVPFRDHNTLLPVLTPLHGPGLCTPSPVHLHEHCYLHLEWICVMPSSLLVSAPSRRRRAAEHSAGDTWENSSPRASPSWPTAATHSSSAPSGNLACVRASPY